MRLETKIEALQSYTHDQWDELLTLTLYVQHPGRFIVVPERAASRRAHIEQRLSEGRTRADIARELGVSAGLITKILNGERR